MDAYKVLLGEILIQRKRITRAQLDSALAVQKQKGGFLGEILVNRGVPGDPMRPAVHRR